MTKLDDEKRQWAKDELRKLVKPGDRVKVLLRHGPNRNGDMRSISPIIGAEDESHLVALALGWKTDNKHGGVKVGGGGMDMGHDLVYSLSLLLYPTYKCLGERTDGNWDRCSSPQHVNTPNKGEDDTRRDYSTERTHKDGYALRFGGWL